MRHGFCFTPGALALALLGCSSGGTGGSGESNQFCHTIAVVSTTCSGCAQVSNSGAAFDGHLNTAAAMGPAGQGSFLATSEAQPPGSIAGVYFILTNPAGVSVTITTFLNGVEQEARGPSTRQGVSDTCSINMTCAFNDGGGSFVGMHTTKTYDAIQATISNSSSGTLQINEICVR
jgi:hypothetical protein